MGGGGGGFLGIGSPGGFLGTGLLGGGKSETSTPYNVGEYEKGYNLKDTGYMRPNIDYTYETAANDPNGVRKLANGVTGYDAIDTADDEYDNYMNNIRSAWAALQGTEGRIAEDTQKYINDRNEYDAYMANEIARNGTATGDRWYRGVQKSGVKGGLLGAKSTGGFSGDQGDTLWRLDNETATRNALSSLDNLYAEQTGAGKGTYQTKVDEYNAALDAYNQLQTNRRVHNNTARQQIQLGANQANSGSGVSLREDQKGLIQDATMLGKGNANDLRNVYSNIDQKDYEGGLNWTQAEGRNGLQQASLNENNAAANDRDHSTTQE